MANAPHSLAEFNAFSDHDLLFRDELRNCEDAVIVQGKGSAIISCDPGRDLWNTVMGTFTKNLSAVPPGELYLYRYGDSKHQSLSRIKLLDYASQSEFHPLGIEYHDASSTLLVSNHHFDGPRIEVFTLNVASDPPLARHTRTIVSPLIKSPNSIAALNKDEFCFTNDHHFQMRKRPFLAMLETYAALPLGGIVHVNMHNESSVTLRALANIPYANGIVLLNTSTLAVASTGSCQVRLYDIRHDATLELTAELRVPFMPDNLSRDERGILLISGHPHPPSLDRLVIDRSKCLEAHALDLQKCHTGTAPSWVSEWTWEGGLRNLYISTREYGSSASAARDTGYNLGLITGLYEKGILVWRD
ncbi:hypothetical protein Plec18170_006964 [Paecilomyces lecythidis]